jgi:hypothetical protein
VYRESRSDALRHAGLLTIEAREPALERWPIELKCVDEVVSVRFIWCAHAGGTGSEGGTVEYRYSMYGID